MIVKSCRHSCVCAEHDKVDRSRLPPPSRFPISVASKGLSHSISRLESIDRALRVSVASKEFSVTLHGAAIPGFQPGQRPDFGGHGSFVRSGSEKPQGLALRYRSEG